jgi:hypothetical protein
MQATTYLPIEQKIIDHAQTLANMSGKAWEVFRDGRGAVDTALEGACVDNHKFRLIVTIFPE